MTAERQQKLTEYHENKKLIDVLQQRNSQILAELKNEILASRESKFKQLATETSQLDDAVNKKRPAENENPAPPKKPDHSKPLLKSAKQAIEDFINGPDTSEARRKERLNQNEKHTSR